MFPWLWFWSPQFHFPFSGSVAQSIEPDTTWFFGGIPPRAGDGGLEQRIHEDVASYGRQLGLITEVLLSLTTRDTITPEQAQESLERLREIHREVEVLKVREKGRLPAPRRVRLQGPRP